MIYYQEQSVYSHRLKTAGRMDCLAEWDGELAVLDFKTSRKPKKKEWIEDSYYLQVSFYAAALYEIANIKVKKGIVLVSVDNDDAQVFEVDVMAYLPRFIELRKQFPYKD
jgi:genome maintenance exonuclease 1